MTTWRPDEERRFGRSKGGRYVYWQNAGKDDRGENLYRLKHVVGKTGRKIDFVTSPKTWTAEELEEAGIRWLENPPSRAQIERSKR